MDMFFEYKAKGDKWIPWHTALGQHEQFIFREIYSLEHLNDRERYMLHFCFRASSWEPLFTEVILPWFKTPGADVPGSPEQIR